MSLQHDGVGNGAVGELTQRLAEIQIGRIGEQLQRLFADGDRAFERQVAVVPEIELEHAAVVLAAAGGNGFDGDVVLDKAWAVRRQSLVFGVARIGRESGPETAVSY